MSFFDLPLDQLEQYRPSIQRPADFDAFWTKTMEENPFNPDAVTVVPAEIQLATINIFDVRFPGYGGESIAAWLLMPKSSPLERDGLLPIVVQYVGYGGGRGIPEDHLTWVSGGYASLIVDSRGQGSSWGSGGITPDYGAPDETGGSYPGFMTKGIQSPYTYYYRRLYVDAAHAIDLCEHLSGVDPDRIFVTGVSQAGGLALVASGLRDNVRGAMLDVPFLCNFERAIGLTDAYPYEEVVRYLATRREEIGQVFDTLSYFDAVLFAQKASCPALFSVGLMDQVAPPSTVFAAKNWHGGPAEIEVYPYNGHEGGQNLQWRRQLEWLHPLASK